MPHSIDPADADRTAETGGTYDAGSAAEAVADPALIVVMRGQIDALDKAIARLVAERARLSERIQSARLNAGGARIELSRERTILGHYRTRLGNEGAALAEAVLRLCRGVR